MLLAVESHLGTFDYGVVVLYFLAMIGVGLYFSGEQTSQEEYFVGRRSLPAFAIGLSIVSTLLSTITYLAAPGDMIQHGLAFATQFLALPFWLAIVLWFWIPFFMRYQLTSVYQYLEMRFNYTLRVIGAGLFLLMRFGWAGMIVYTASRAVARMTNDVPERVLNLTGWEMTEHGWLVCLMLVMGVVTTAYTFLGGIRAVVWTDVTQFVVMFGGALTAIGYVWLTTGSGPGAWWQQAQEMNRAAPVWFSTDWTLDRTVFLVCLNTFFWRVCTHCGDQVATQRYFATSGVRDALRSNIIGAVGDFFMMLVLGMVGLALLGFFSPEINPEIARGEGPFGGAFDPNNPDDATQAFPAFIVSYLPDGIGGLIMAALFAAAMSSISSGLNSISAVVTVDFYRPWRSGPPNQTVELLVGRLTTIGAGVFMTAVAFLVATVIAADPQNQNIIDLSVRVFNLFLGPMASLFIVGIFIPRAGGLAAALATLCGIVVALSICFWGDLSRVWPAVFVGGGPSMLLVVPITTTVTVIVASLLSLVLPPADARRIQGHTWWTRNEFEPMSS